MVWPIMVRKARSATHVRPRPRPSQSEETRLSAVSCLRLPNESGARASESFVPRLFQLRLSRLGFLQDGDVCGTRVSVALRQLPVQRVDLLGADIADD